MVKIPIKGLVYKTSRISYITNYFIVALLIIFLLLLRQEFSLNLTLTPTTVEELIPIVTLFSFIIVAACLLGEPDIERALRHYIVTNNEVMKVEGIFRKKKISVPYQSVADVRVEKGVIGRIFNFGTVYVASVGKEAVTIVMKGLSNAEEVYRIIQNKINLMRGAILREGSRKEKE